MLFPLLDDPAGAAREALRFGGVRLSYRELAAAARALADELPAAPARVAVWATPSISTAIGTVAALRAGVPAVPVNPRSGAAELTHIVGDSSPEAVLVAAGEPLPPELHGLRRIDVAVGAPASTTTSRVDGGTCRRTNHPEDPALVVYTSGTTGPPKGVVLPHRAIYATLDALADAWQWSADDVVLHGLPLFHVHGLVLGTLGPLHRGGTSHHLGRFTPAGLGAALAEWDRPRMVFGVPTMYHRLAAELEQDTALAATVARARVLVSGSAGLPVRDQDRIARACGQRVIERYGMTETLMNTSVRLDESPPSATPSLTGGPPLAPGTVGGPLPGVDLRLVGEDGAVIDARDGSTIGEIQVRGPNLFTEYLNRPEATAEAFDGPWFRTGDMATVDQHGAVRIVGRKATDLIKSGGFKIGAGEIEAALLEHPAVAEAAVTGEPDADLGERIVAWIVPDGRRPEPAELADHVANLLAPHKRPRDVRYLDALPRNELGKVTKRALG